MKAAEILGVETVGFVEPAFAALTDSSFNMVLAETPGDEGRLLVDENEEPLALAFHGPDGWTAGSFLCRNPSIALIERFENMNGGDIPGRPCGMGSRGAGVFQRGAACRRPPVH